MKQLMRYACVLGAYLIASCAQLQAHDHHEHVVVEEHGHWHHPHERVYVSDPWYHHEHVYYHHGYAYPHYYYGSPYYYYDPNYYWQTPGAEVNLNVNIP